MKMEKENEYDTTRTFLPEFHIRFEKLSKSDLDSRKFADLLASGGRIKIKIKINKQNQDQDRDGVDPYILDQGSGASSNVEKENTHYQGLPEDVGPDSGKSWSQRSKILSDVFFCDSC